MILNVQFPPMQGYKSAEEAISASKATSAEFRWFDPKLAVAQTIEATSFGSDWFAMRLSNGLRLVVRAAGSILEASLDSEPLPESTLHEREIALCYEAFVLCYEAFVGPVTRVWEPHQEAANMLGKRVFAITFHPHRLVVSCTRQFAIWIRLMHEKPRGQPRLKWTAAEE